MMSPPFFTTPLYKYKNKCKKLIVYTLGFHFLLSSCYGDDHPGVIESLERLLSVHRQEISQYKQENEGKIKKITSISDLSDLKISPHFMRSIILHSDDNFLKLTKNDECKFLSVLENNLLKSLDGDIENISLVAKNKDQTIETVTISKDDFFNQIYQKKCYNNREFTTLFNDTNILKTLKSVKFTVPKNSAECESVHSEWLLNTYTPYLCQIQQVLKKSKNKTLVDLYQDKIPAFQKTYLDNLCNNINSPINFCQNYLKSDIWNKVINNEAPLYQLQYKCQNFQIKKDLSAEIGLNDLKDCANKFVNQPDLCETNGNKNFPSLFPLQNCDQISIALNKSKLVTNYHDCPGNTDNEAIINIHRIINHFTPRKIITSKESCSDETNYTFAQLNFELKNENKWPMKICYKSNIKGKEDCLPYIPGHRDNDPLSEDQVIAKMLYREKGASSKTKCRIVDSLTYNPLRSDFKSGCFIVYDSENCTTLSCNKKVIWEEKPLEDIKFIGTPTFDYFPTAFINERFSFEKMLNESKKTENRSVKNLTDLKFYLDKIPNGIIHGVGCAEDLLPEEFQRTAMNQCLPMPFIVDGHVNKSSETWLVLRAPIDDLHSPRLILWQNIFNAVSAYRELHPLNTWTLYGIKK